MLFSVAFRCPTVRRTHSPGLPFLPWLILAVSLGLTWLIWDHERHLANRELRSQFDFSLRETVSQIEQRIAAYQQTLIGLQGLFATIDLSNRRAVHDFVQAQKLDANFSGIQVIGVVKHVLPGQMAGHIDEMRRLGFADYRIQPEGKRDSYAPVIQYEPDVFISRTALGHDALTDQVHRLAMENARDSGFPALTGKVQLAIDKEGRESPGFIMYLPIFESGKPRDSLATRRKHLIGWVYASLNMGDFMASLYGRLASDLSLEIYDDVSRTDAELLYRSGGNTGERQISAPLYAANEYMVVAGHNWTLTLSTRDNFKDRLGGNAVRVIAVTGVSLSILLSLLVWFMVSGRSRAMQLAERMTEELRHMAQHDSLTDLPNRVLFSERVHHALAYAKRHTSHFALIFLDLDNFKPVNDTYGHAIGDHVLRELARRLQEAVRASDTVGRIGGDEFVVLMPELHKTEAVPGLVEKIHHAVSQPYRINGIELAISCSFGVAIYPQDGMDELSLTKSADQAMYRAKGAGRDGVQFANRNAREQTLA